MSDKNSTDQLDQAHETREALQEDEISLIDLWRVIVKRKKMIIGSLLLSLLLVGAWIAITKPVYESRAVLGIGQVGPLESPQLLVQRLKEEYRIKDDSEGEQKFPLIKEAKTMEKTLANGIEITAQAHSAAEAQKFLADVTTKVLRQHLKLYDMARNEQQKQLESLEKQKDQVEQVLILLRSRVTSVAGSDAALAGLLALEQDRLLQQLPQIEQQQAAVRLAMSELQSRPTILLRQPTLPAKPVKPKPALYLALAAVLGLMLGVFGAFFAEFVGKTRARMAVN
ncbi:MAG: Wzz/FepE/Etk N-terminal domain-containing protein [Gammaproteobacteria bacterium]